MFSVLSSLSVTLFPMLVFSRRLPPSNPVGRSGQSNMRLGCTPWIFLQLKRSRTLRKSCLLFSHNNLNCVLDFVLEKHASRMKALAERWGPVPRILLRILRSPRYEAALEKRVTDAVNKATTQPRDVFDAITNHISPKISGSSIVFFTTPKSIIDRQLRSVQVPTRWLADQLVDRLFRYGEDQRDNLFRIMSYHLARSTLGWMFRLPIFLARKKLPVTWSNGVTETVSPGSFHPLC